MSETLDMVPGAEVIHIPRSGGEVFSDLETAAHHLSEHTNFRVRELMAEAEARASGLVKSVGMVTKNALGTSQEPHIQLELN